ncbi:MAG: signal peptidase bacterial type [Anaerocolumna sp.]|jgi:signal peptidase I|nr:signal peptidase bacterial type [Anaerocolumna sp.]
MDDELKYNRNETAASLTVDEIEKDVDLSQNDRVNEELDTDNKKEDNKLATNGEKSSYGKDIRDMLIYFVVIIAAVLLVHNFVGQQIEVSGSSMEGTLHDEDHLILEKISYETGSPQRYDIVVFRPYTEEKNTFYIKRIIGLPGETVQIIGSDIYINDEILTEDYGNALIEEAGIAAEPITLNADEYFVLGDNRNNSKDSRNPVVGVVHRKSILGRAWVRIWPLDDFGVLRHQ